MLSKRLLLGDLICTSKRPSATLFIFVNVAIVYILWKIVILVPKCVMCVYGTQELERLTQVAAAAFQSGTESVELLKKQVAAQRRELEDMKFNHG